MCIRDRRICDCVAVISNGELIEQDTVSEVFSHPKTPLAQKFIQSTLHLDLSLIHISRQILFYQHVLF